MNENFFYYLYGMSHQNAWFDSLVIFLATDFGLIVLFALIYFLYKHEDKKRGLKEILVVLGAGALAWGIAHVIKYFYPAARPDSLIQAITPLFAYGNGIDSFPSGHATFFSALATGLYFYHKKLGVFFAICAILIGLARVISGVHFPVDILAGFILGALVALGVYFLIRRASFKPTGTY